jgi:Fic family protein
MTAQHDLVGTPYLIANEQVWEDIGSRLGAIDERVRLLRSGGKLTKATLDAYFGQTRFEQIAESNGIEGSTLTVGETEQAILKGVTISGHDPQFSMDAVALAKALDKMVQIARNDQPTTFTSAGELHSIILHGRSGAGVFRSNPVFIRGSKHVPPGTWQKVMADMSLWEAWSKENASAHPILRAAILHAWMVHIHPYIDGNGRTARAVMNLELIAHGYPPIIIRRTERLQYFEFLACADEGDIGPFLEVVVAKTDQALSSLEQVAAAKQGYNKEIARVRELQHRRYQVWAAAVELLQRFVESELRSKIEEMGGEFAWRAYPAVPIEAYRDLCSGRVAPLTWVFRFEIDVPALPKNRRLLWVGCPTAIVRTLTKGDAIHPSMFWSVPTGGFPAWRPAADDQSICFKEATLVGDEWLCIRRDNSSVKLGPLALGSQIVKATLGAIGT